jgi:putative ABC transport system permease protein
MRFSKLIRVAWEGLTLNKVRSFLTTLGVIIGVASVIIMLAISAGAEAVIAEQINALGANLVIVSPARGIPGSSRTLVLDDAYAIQEQVVGITGISAEQAPPAQTVEANNVTLEEMTILGTTSSFPSVRNYSVAEGRYFTEEENQKETRLAVLGSGLANDLFGVESPLGQTVTIGNVKFVVIGVMESKGIVSDVDYDGRIYIPINVVLDKFTSSNRLGGDRIRTIYVEAESQDKVDSVIIQISSLLAERHDVDPQNPDFSIQTQQDIIDTQQATTETFRNLLGWVAGVSLVVGGIGIMNIMLVSVTERTREIGLRMALGARPDDVLMQFLIEAIILSLVGGVIGVIAGTGGSYLFGRFSEMRTVIVPASIPLAFGASAVVGIFFGYYPATRAAKLDPIVALRHE